LTMPRIRRMFHLNIDPHDTHVSKSGAWLSAFPRDSRERPRLVEGDRLTVYLVADGSII
jgi:hypothetical protein